MKPHEKPGSPGDILEHHGIKGMKWGVRNEDKGGDREGGQITDAKQIADHNAQTKMYMAASMPKLTEKQAHAEFKQNQENFLNKFQASQPAPEKGSSPGKIESVAKDRGLTPGQKKALLAAGGTAAVVGGLYLANRYVKQNPEAIMGLLDKAAGGHGLGNIGTKPESLGVKSFAEIDALAGKPIDPKQFNGLVGFSQGKTWFGSYYTDAAFARPEFELPAGHTFHRLSTSSETGFRPATYATHSIDDFNRYVAGFRGEIGDNLNHVTWTTTKPTRVPDLTTVLGQMSEVLKEQGMPHDPGDTKFMYQQASGTDWSSPHAKKLIAKLKSHGYGALVDEMDAGVIGETPLVFFNHESATPKRVTKFDKEAINRAELLLKEIGNPPGRKY